MSIARISCRYAKESPQSVHFLDLVRSSLLYFDNRLIIVYFDGLESLIEPLKTKQNFSKSAST